MHNSGNIRKTRSEYFPMKLELFDLFFNLAGTMYTSQASVALCTARMTHAYLGPCASPLQAAFEAEGLDLQSTRDGIGTDANNLYHFAAAKLFSYLESDRVLFDWRD